MLVSGPPSGWRGTMRSSADRLWLVAGREIGLPNIVAPQRCGPRTSGGHGGCANPACTVGATWNGGERW